MVPKKKSAIREMGCWSIANIFQAMGIGKGVQMRMSKLSLNWKNAVQTFSLYSKVWRFHVDNGVETVQTRVEGCYFLQLYEIYSINSMICIL